MNPSFLEACETGAFATAREILLSWRSSGKEAAAAELLNAAYPYRQDRYSPLVLAASNGHVEIVQLLLGFGADVTYRSPAGRTRKGTMAVHEAAEAGHAEVLRVLLHHDESKMIELANWPIGYVGVTPLYVAAAHGHAEATEVLLEAGAKNYSKPASGEEGTSLTSLVVGRAKPFSKSPKREVDTPLLVACTYGHDEVVRLLLRNSTHNINDKDSAGRTPLFIAVKVRNTGIVRQLLRAGADVNEPEHHFSNTPLHEAVKRERLDLVQELLAGGAELQENHLAETPLFMAIEKGNLDIVRTIVQARRDQVLMLHPANTAVTLPHPLYNDNRPANRQRGPLHYACSFLNSINLDMVKLLHDMGTPVNQRDPSYLGATPLLICSRCDRSACSSGRCKATVAEYLIQRGAEVFLADNYGRTPLHRAAQSGCETMVQLLLRTRAKHKLDQPDLHLHATPLHFAVQGYSSQGSARVVEILADKGANVNHQDKSGMTPLHIASRCGAVDIVRVLLERQAEVSVPSSDGKTPLHVAVEAGHSDVVQLLVKHSKRVDQTDVRGWTPLAIACAHGNADIVRALMEVHVAGERGSVEHVKRLLLHTAT